MRLINTRTLEFKEFMGSHIPPYVILSHTWGKDEISFQDMNSSARFNKTGYTKITQTCRIALEHGLEYAWIDTCNIDKSSSAELSESINSMYNWYRDATVCYVFLEDMEPHANFANALPQCRWLTRSWTLQEMLAASRVEFYDNSWEFRGTKIAYSAVLSSSTRIPISVLRGKTSILDCSVAERMSWAANREATRVEDTAYSLLGIFNVNMALIYGEGKMAFRRLQEEIIKRNNDLTIFAWDNTTSSNPSLVSVLAESPAAFAYSRGISPIQGHYADFSVTNRGVLISPEIPILPVYIQSFNNSDSIDLDDYSVTFNGKPRYCLRTGVLREQDSEVRIYLRKLGPNVFVSSNTYASCHTHTTPRTPQATSEKERDGRDTKHEFRNCIAHSLQVASSFMTNLDFYGFSNQARDNSLRLGRDFDVYIPQDGRLDEDVRIASNYILADIDLPRITALHLESRDWALCVPRNNPNWRVVRVSPGDLWDNTDCIFLRHPRKRTGTPSYSMVLAIQIAVESLSQYRLQDLMVLCSFKGNDQICKILGLGTLDQEAKILRQRMSRPQYLNWADIEFQLPGLASLNDQLEVKVDSRTYHVSVTFPTTRFADRGRGPSFYICELQVNVVQLGPTSMDLETQNAIGKAI